MIKLNEQQKQKIESWTLECFPNEMCGVLTVDDFIPTTNTAVNPQGEFEIKKDEFNRIIREHEVIAIVHSHTRVPGINYGPIASYDARTPSPRDVRMSRALGIPFLITATDGETVLECIEYPGDPNSDLLDRPFIFYINDCYTLVRDYLWQRQRILLDGHHDTFDWINDGKGIVYPFYDAYYEEWGFHEIREEELEVGDIVIMSFGGTANHLGVYVGEYKIFHHVVNQPPAIMSLARVKSYIHRYIRHNNKPKEVNQC